MHPSPHAVVGTLPGRLATWPAVHEVPQAALKTTTPQPRAEAQVDVAALFAEHGPFLLRVVERLTGPGPHVEDVVQEAFLTLHAKRWLLASTTPWRPWLYRVAVNLVQHHRRSFARRARLANAVEHQSAPTGLQDPHQVLDDRSNAARVRAAVMEIPLLQRDVFVLYEFEELTGQEISDLLGIPENTVWSRLRVARTAFKQALLRSDGGAP